MTINDIRTWIMSIRKASRTKSEAKRKALIVVEANNLLQVREFSGKLFVCYRDIPIIEDSQLNCPIEVVINKAREVYLDFCSDEKRIRP